MFTRLSFYENQFSLIRKHLHQNKYLEQVVFLFLDYIYEKNRLCFKVKDYYLVGKNDLYSQTSEYLELTDDARAKIIKMAWDKKTALGEIHSHPMSIHKTAFSYSDMKGFQEFVPHVWWRLKNKPYLALVSGSRSIDALVWSKHPDKPQPLSEINIKNKLVIKPTGLTMERVKGGCYGY